MWSPLEGYTTVRFCFVRKGETFLSLCHHRRLLGLWQGVELGQSDWCAALSPHMQPCWRPGERIFKTVKWNKWKWWERKWDYLKIRYQNAKGDFPWVMCLKGSVAGLGCPGERPSQDCGVESLLTAGGTGCSYVTGASRALRLSLCPRAAPTYARTPRQHSSKRNCLFALDSPPCTSACLNSESNTLILDSQTSQGSDFQTHQGKKWRKKVSFEIRTLLPIQSY